MSLDTLESAGSGRFGSPPLGGSALSDMDRAVLQFGLLVSGLVNLPRLVSVGSVSLLAVWTVSFVWLCLLALAVNPAIAASDLRRMAPYLAFTTWAVIRAGSSSFTVNAAQNLLVFITFALAVLLAARSTRDCRYSSDSIVRAFRIATAIAILIYTASVVLGGPGSDRLMGPRGFALFAMLGGGLYAVEQRYRLPGAGLSFIVVAGVILLSLSRVAFIAVMFAIPLARLARGGKIHVIRASMWTVVVSLLGVAVVLLFEPFRNRFTQGDYSFGVGGLVINTSGRFVVWAFLLGSIIRAPWFGYGLGSSEIAVETMWPQLVHAHSDYIRILYDLGLVGLLLWLWSGAVLLSGAIRQWRECDRIDDRTAIVHATAALALVLAATAMATDNAVVYVFVMLPLGVLVGLSLGLERQNNEEPIVRRLSFSPGSGSDAKITGRKRNR